MPSDSQQQLPRSHLNRLVISHRRTAAISGFILLVLSTPPLFLAARERVIASSLAARYVIHEVSEKGGRDQLTATIGRHRVELVDDLPVAVHQPFKADQDLREPGVVRIHIDGQLHSSVMIPAIRVMETNQNRYWGFVRLLKLQSLDGPERLVVAQKLPRATYRVTSIFADGRVADDEFDYSSRCNPPTRALLIRDVVGHPSGFCSDVMTGYPSFVVPLLYPIASAAGGLLLLVFSVLPKRLA